MQTALPQDDDCPCGHDNCCCYTSLGAVATNSGTATGGSKTF